MHLPPSLTSIIATSILAFCSVLISPELMGSDGQNRKSKANLDLPYDAGFDKEVDEIAPEVVVFYGQAFECDGIFYCLDRSASTCNGELAIEKREAIRNVREFSKDMEFAFVFFDKGIRKFPPNGKPVRATAGNKQRAIAFLSALQCGRGTCVREALLETLTYVNRLHRAPRGGRVPG